LPRVAYKEARHDCTREEGRCEEGAGTKDGDEDSCQEDAREARRREEDRCREEGTCEAHGGEESRSEEDGGGEEGTCEADGRQEGTREADRRQEGAGEASYRGEEGPGQEGHGREEDRGEEGACQARSCEEGAGTQGGHEERTLTVAIRLAGAPLDTTAPANELVAFGEFSLAASFDLLADDCASDIPFW
jgi:hypothetical protein